MQHGRISLKTNRILVNISIFYIVTLLCVAQSYAFKDWPEDFTLQNKNSVAAKALDTFAFQAENSNKPTITNALLVVKNGKIIFEKYTNNFNKEKRQNSWSISKSVLNSVLGAAVQENAISLDDSICTYIKTPKQNYCGILVRHLAQHSSGLDWSEDYENSDTPKDSAVLSNLFGEGINNMERFIIDKHSVVFPPGTHWNYSSGDSNLLASVLKKAIEKKSKTEWNQYPWKKIFEPIGIKSAAWERDEQNVFVASSYLYISARDLARFALLYTNDGKINSTRILPENWVRQSLEAVPAMISTKQKLKPGEEANSYGLHWWLNLANPVQKLPSPWPSNPPDTFAALGHWGQYLFIIPSEQLIIVRFGNDRYEKLNKDKLLSLVRKLAQ